MSWSWKIATVRGIGVYIHATFWLLVAWIMFAHVMGGHTLVEALKGVALVLLVFLCVVLHEFGHALTAQRFGVQTRDITLYPIGGIARLERIPRDPRQELLIAVAGPAVNVVIAALLALVLIAGKSFVGPEAMSHVGGGVMAKLFWFNVVMVGFNLLPAFPMDGGRVLRAFLAERMDYGRATQLAANVGQGMAFLFGLMGLFGNPMLLFIAFFVYMGASQEAAMVQTELAFRGVPVREAMVTRFRTLAPTDSLASATQQLLAGSQLDFPVLDGDRLVGILTRNRLIEGLSQEGLAAYVSEEMLPVPTVAAPTDNLEETFQRMRTAEVQTLPVLENGRLVGMLTLENIGEFLMIRNAIQGEGPAALRTAEAHRVEEAVEAAAEPAPHGPTHGQAGFARNRGLQG